MQIDAVNVAAEVGRFTRRRTESFLRRKVGGGADEPGDVKGSLLKPAAEAGNHLPETTGDEKILHKDEEVDKQ